MKKDKLIDMIGQKVYIHTDDQIDYDCIKDQALANTDILFRKADHLKEIFAWAEVYYGEVQSLKDAWWASMTKKYKLKKYHCSYYSDYGFMLILDQEDKK